MKVYLEDTPRILTGAGTTPWAGFTRTRGTLVEFLDPETLLASGEASNFVVITAPGLYRALNDAPIGGSATIVAANALGAVIDIAQRCILIPMLPGYRFIGSGTSLSVEHAGPWVPNGYAPVGS